ncbi:MAG: CAP domain-containing protein [Ruminococcus sp.]|nr:CAP domain-containing protein [Ruminococcus sp.]
MKKKSVLNKILAIILSALVCSSATLTGVSAATSTHDIDGDGMFDINDSTYLQMYLAGYFDISDSALKIADADHSLTVDIGDVTRVQMLLAGYTFETPTTKPTTQPTTQKPTVQPTTQPTTQKPTVQPTTQPTTQKPTENLNEYADEAIRLGNIERAKVGAGPLKKNTVLTEIAQIRSEEITREFSHFRPNGKDCFSLFFEKGVTSFTIVGENLARGQKTPEQAVKEWMNSSSHRDALLDPRYTQTGVACYKKGNSLYWVQVFMG